MREFKPKNKPSLRDWEILIEAWWAVMDHYLTINRNDLPYWWYESGNVSSLAAAAWKLGGTAIQEVQESNKSNEQSMVGQARKGRVDLRINIPQFELECEIEAKFDWAPTAEAARMSVSRLRADAGAQLSRLRKCAERAPVGAALCFVCPMVRTPSEGAPILKGLLDWFEGDAERASSFIAVYEPPLGTQTHDTDNNGKHFYPGITLYGKTIWDSRREGT